MATKKTEKKIKMQVLWLEISKLKIDRDYQRGLKNKHKKIALSLSEEALGLPTVGRRKNGTYWVVDGQQRLEALKRIGRKKVKCNVFDSEGPKHEADIFQKIQDRAQLTPGEDFKARLEACDEVAWKIKDTVEEAGFNLSLTGGGNTCRDISCVLALCKIYHRQGVEAISFALELIRDCWPNEKLAVSTHMVSGLAQFYALHDGVFHYEDLVKKMRKVDPHTVVYCARMDSAISGGFHYAIAAQVEKVHCKKR